MRNRIFLFIFTVLMFLSFSGNGNSENNIIEGKGKFPGDKKNIGQESNNDRAEVEKPNEATDKSEENIVLLYGRHGCGMCRRMMALLNESKIKFTFLNIDSDRKSQYEMWNKVRENYPNLRRVGLPVMDVNGKVLISPSYEEVKSYLNK